MKRFRDILTSFSECTRREIMRCYSLKQDFDNQKLIFDNELYPIDYTQDFIDETLNKIIYGIPIYTYVQQTINNKWIGLSSELKIICDFLDNKIKINNCIIKEVSGTYYKDLKDIIGLQATIEDYHLHVYRIIPSQVLNEELFSMINLDVPYKIKELINLENKK